MLVLLIFAFISGLFTILAPCIWPLLPIILSSSSTGGKSKPLGITLGIMASFSIFTLTLSYIVKIIPFDPNFLRLFAVVIIGFLGLTLVIPQLNILVEGFVSKLSSRFGITKSTKGGFWAGFVTGFSLGLVWSPCAGPILATIAALSAMQAVNIGVILTTLAYVAGVGIPLFLFATLGNTIFVRSRVLNKYTGKIQQIFGIIMILTAIAIYTNYDKVLQVKLLNAFPSYSNSLTNLESNNLVKKQLDSLKQVKLENIAIAPEIIGIITWLNVEKPLTLAELKGKVVLIDFWTYTCINCIRTLPHVTGWYEKYKDQGFVVIGVHTPEFEFEKKTENVLKAMKQFNVRYPVAQDNDYATWNAYQNQYWPAEYLIDAHGIIRKTHFGEGEYEEMESAIKELLREAGQKVDTSTENVPDKTPQTRVSPETYLGFARMDRFASREKPRLGKHTFTASSGIPDDYFAFAGKWNIDQEFSTAEKGSILQFNFSAEHVYLVMKPSKAGDRVKVYVDGMLVTKNQGGKDIKDGMIKLDVERLYDIIDLKGQKENHILKLEFLDEEIECFAFTFG